MDAALRGGIDEFVHRISISRMIKKLLAPMLLLIGAVACFGLNREPHTFVSRIERLDPALDVVLAPDAKIEKLAEGFRWTEGPSWYVEKNAAGKELFKGVVFSDVLANTSYRWQEGWN